MSHPLLEVRGLSIGYATSTGEIAPVLQDVSLSLGRGQSLGIVGESGCGKSTLGLALLGFLRDGSRVLAGEVRFEGVNLFGLDPESLRKLRGRRIALVPQSAAQSLTPSMRIGAQLAESLAIHRGMAAGEARAEAERLLGQVRLPAPAQLAQRFPHQLSGGQQQRVAIAMALAGGPELLVLDELTTGLDVTTQAHILDLLDEIRARTGVAMVYVSHDLGVIARVSASLAVMYAGEVVELGATAALFARPRHPYTRGLLGSVPRLDQAGLPQALPGQPPAPLARPPGCAFAPRCAFADEQCVRAAPPLVPTIALTPHVVRCYHSERVATSGPAERAVALTPLAPVAAGPPLVEVSDLYVHYARGGVDALWRRLRGVAPGPPALSGVSLRIARGETLALVGESGSGKSTMARAIAGLLPVSAGGLRMGADDLRRDSAQRPAALRRSIQLIFQNPDASLNPRQTVGQILERPLQIFFGLPQGERRRRVAGLLDQMRLGAHYATRFPGQLSGGEKQRVAIARAFAAEPELVLCDEVVSALDVSVQAAVLELLMGLKAERGVTYLFISHDLAVVRAIADRVAVLYGGQLCEQGAAAQVFAAPFHPYTESLIAAAPAPTPGRRGQAMAADTAVAAPATGRGCPFAARCPRRLGSICAEEAPPWQEGLAGHSIRCHIPLAELQAAQAPAALTVGAALAPQAFEA